MCRSIMDLVNMDFGDCPKCRLKLSNVYFCTNCFFDLQTHDYITSPIQKKEKVFCKNCKYLSFRLNSCFCDSPNNEGKDINWYEETITKNKCTPNIINKNNDCEWFEANFK